jgi:hypothetical protein
MEKSSYERGWEDGHDHMDYDNPYDPDTDEYIDYDNGYSDGMQCCL